MIEPTLTLHVVPAPLSPAWCLSSVAECHSLQRSGPAAEALLLRFAPVAPALR